MSIHLCFDLFRACFDITISIIFFVDFAESERGAVYHELCEMVRVNKGELTDLIFFKNAVSKESIKTTILHSSPENLYNNMWLQAYEKNDEL